MSGYLLDSNIAVAILINEKNAIEREKAKNTRFIIKIWHLQKI